MLSSASRSMSSGSHLRENRAGICTSSGSASGSSMTPWECPECGEDEGPHCTKCGKCEDCCSCDEEDEDAAVEFQPSADRKSAGFQSRKRMAVRIPTVARVDHHPCASF